MKRIVAILLFVSLLLPLASSMAHLALFGIQQKEIARTLCVKKSIASNSCQGKCYLNKKLKAVQDHQAGSEEESTSLKFQKLEYLGHAPLSCCSSTSSIVISLTYKNLSTPLLTSVLEEVFHPPLS